MACPLRLRLRDSRGAGTMSCPRRRRPQLVVVTGGQIVRVGRPIESYITGQAGTTQDVLAGRTTCCTHRPTCSPLSTDVQPASPCCSSSTSASVRYDLKLLPPPVGRRVLLSHIQSINTQHCGRLPEKTNVHQAGHLTKKHREIKSDNLRTQNYKERKEGQRNHTIRKHTIRL